MAADLDVYAIHFDNLFYLKIQLPLLRAFLLRANVHVVDNAIPNSSASRAIHTICSAHSVNVLRSNYYSKFGSVGERMNPSEKLGHTLNWLLRTHIRRRKTRFFGFLDGDTFPLRPVDPRARLQANGAYGMPVFYSQHSRWYAWPLLAAACTVSLRASLSLAEMCS